MNSYLLTWNPTNWDWQNYQDCIQLTTDSVRLHTFWSTGNTKAIEPGSRCYLFRHFNHQGIIGSGYSTGEVYEKEKWDGSKRLVPYVDVIFDRILAAEDVISVNSLKSNFPNRNWSNIQSSGQTVPNELDQMWIKHLQELEAEKEQSQSTDYAIITENDESDWDDQTGVAYHFPKRYQKYLAPGTRVVYYKGKMRNSDYIDRRLTKDPHYFGIATIGSHFEERESEKGDLFATIENFYRFSEPVPLKVGSDYLEEIPDTRTSNYWRDGVRVCSQETFKRICNLATVYTSGELDSESLRLEVEHDFVSGVEGEKKQKFVTVYERDRKLTLLAKLIHGFKCYGCGFDFKKAYGDLGEEFIHIHHTQPISQAGGKINVDPKKDLIPLCPNCHAMVHRKKNSTLDLSNLKKLVNFRIEYS